MINAFSWAQQALLKRCFIERYSLKFDGFGIAVNRIGFKFKKKSMYGIKKNSV